ncbi:MAG: hypothetical protein ACHQ9S_02825 [Candidatus Binatia bacterium]
MRPDGKRPAGRREWLTLTGWLLAALVIRVALLVALHDAAYVFDHLSYVYWGSLAVERGPLGLYDPPADRLRPGWRTYRVYTGTNIYANRMWKWERPIRMREVPQPIIAIVPDGGRLSFTVPAGEGDYRFVAYHPSHFNYPPLAAYLYWGLGLLHRALDPTQEPDTRLAHALFAAPAIVCDVALGLVILLALRRLGGGAERKWTLLALLCPALVWDSSVWLQTDAMGALPITAAVALLNANSVVLASALCGLGLLVKPQVLWVVPVVVYAALRTGSLRTILASGLAAAAVALVGSGSFLVSTGRLWLEVAYLDNASLVPRLSLNAYNPWWVVELIRGAVLSPRPHGGIVHPSPTDFVHPVFTDTLPWIGGLTPRAVGFALLAGAFGMVLLGTQRYFRGRTLNFMVPAYLLYLAGFIFPTQVHERYIVYALPLGLGAAATLPSVRRTLLPLNVLALMSTTGYLLFQFPLDLGAFSAFDWARAGVLGAVALGTLALIAIPLRELLAGAPPDALQRCRRRRHASPLPPPPIRTGTHP